jgi:hypothetical protein
MQIEKAARIAAVVVAILLAVVFIVCIARADYPNGFEKIKEICDRSPEIMPGVRGVEIRTCDTLNEDNKGGTLLLMAGDGEEGIGVGIGVFDKNEQVIVYVAIYHMNDGSTVIVNLLTGEEDSVSDETVSKFIYMWLRLYYQAVGTPI